MLLRLSGSGRLHRQVYDALRTRILSGDIGRGARLPSTRALRLLGYSGLSVDDIREGIRRLAPVARRERP